MDRPARRMYSNRAGDKNLHNNYHNNYDCDNGTHANLLLLLLDNTCGFTESNSDGPEEYREESINGRHCGRGLGVLCRWFEDCQLSRRMDCCKGGRVVIENHWNS